MVQRLCGACPCSAVSLLFSFVIPVISVMALCFFTRKNIYCYGEEGILPLQHVDPDYCDSGTSEPDKVVLTNISMKIQLKRPTREADKHCVCHVNLSTDFFVASWHQNIVTENDRDFEVSFPVAIFRLHSWHNL